MIISQDEFDKILSKQVTKCVEHVSKKIYDCLHSHILSDVYYFDGGNNWYNNGTKVPTFEFLNAFEFQGVKQSVSEISNLLFYDWMNMSPPDTSNRYVHGNYNSGEDRREDLAEILNVYGSSPSGTYDLRDKKRNAFWDEAIKEIEANFNNWAQEAYNLYLK